MTIYTDKFTGKAQVYAQARPGYPDEAIEYIRLLVPPNAVFADIGAGTGKFTEHIARCGYEVFAVEPSADMREQLAITLAPFPKAQVISASAEATTLLDHSMDVITCAQALGWFDLDAFRKECRRIGKPNATVISIHNETPGSGNNTNVKHVTSKQATAIFFKEPTVREFPNPLFYTQESWLAYRSSHSYSPLPGDAGYEAYMAEMNAIFVEHSVNGVIRIDEVTKVYSERVG